MRKIAFLLIIAAAVYGYVYYVPVETKHNALAAIGLADFFQETLPNFLRQRLSIPQNPVVKRQKLLDELSGAIGNIERELEVVVPPNTNGQPLSALKLPSAQEIQERIEKTREYLAQSETMLEDLKKSNPGQGIFQKTAERILDKILPAPGPETGGIGGDTSGGVSECRCAQ